MIQSLETSDKTTVKPKSAVNLLLVTVLDTTWRAFVPTIGGTFIGIGLDHTFNVAPWFTIAMIAIGFLTSGILITIQLKGVRK